jgi:hypothetical protein
MNAIPAPGPVADPSRRSGATLSAYGGAVTDVN